MKKKCGKQMPLQQEITRKFLVESWVPAGGGFGRPVLVREYHKPYGPVATTLETLLVALTPGLKDVFE